MKVLFDFDDVIFDTKAFKEFFFTTLERRGYTNVRHAYEEYRKKPAPFSLRTFIMQATYDSSEENVETLYEEVMSKCGQFVNRKVIDIIVSLGRESSYIVTHGDSQFQMDKIRRSIGEHLVHTIVTVPGSKAEIIKDICKAHPDEEIIFVDDRLHFINDIPVSECQNLKTVLFNEHGLENLRSEIDASKVEEGERLGEVKMDVPNSDFKREAPPQHFGMH